MFKSTMILHALVQSILPCMTEGRMSQIMGQCDRLDQVLVKVQVACDRATDLRHLQAMG